MNNNETGNCQCGLISYSFNKKKVISAHHCHCKDCQRSTGCGKATIIYVPDKKLKLDGEIKFYESKGSLGTTIRRGFCAECGSGVVSYAKQLPVLKFIKAGTLDDSSWLKIDSSFFSKSSEAWNAPVKDIKCYEGNPDMLSSLKNVIKSL